MVPSALVHSLAVDEPTVWCPSCGAEYRVGTPQCAEHSRILGRADAVAVQPGVDLHRQSRGGAGALDRVEKFGELAHRRHRDLHVRAQRGREIGAGRVQPREDRRGDAVAPQRERLVNGRDPEFGRPGDQRGAGHAGGAVPVAVGLDHRHHPRGPGVIAQQPNVVGDRVEVDHGLGDDIGRQRCGQRNCVHAFHRCRLSQTDDAVRWLGDQCAKCCWVSNTPPGFISSMWVTTLARSSYSERAKSAEKPSRTTMRSTATFSAPSGMV